MRYGDAVSFRQALEQRFKDSASGDAARLSRMRKRVAFERLLARLATVAPERWLLKGGFAIDLRLPDTARATLDIDIEWRGEQDRLIDTLIDASALRTADFFAFSIERAATDDDRFAGSQRFRVESSLAGRLFEAFPLDVGFERGTRRGERLVSDLLGFAGIEPVAVLVIAGESHVAEKLHAYSRTYGDRPSTRVKDLVDLILIAAAIELDAATLSAEITATFDRRATHAVPTALTPPPADWSAPYRSLATEVGIPRAIRDGHASAARLLDPVLGQEKLLATWRPREGSWTPNARP